MPSACPAEWNLWGPHVCYPFFFTKLREQERYVLLFYYVIKKNLFLSLSEAAGKKRVAA